MASLLSPGVYIQEVDASAIVPSVSNNVAFVAGEFNAGPVNQPYVITNKQEYENTFGYPTNDNFNSWFQGYKFFDYANQLIVTRGFVKSPAEPFNIIDNPTYLFTTQGDVLTNLDNLTPINLFTLSKDIESLDVDISTPTVKFYTTESMNINNKKEVGDTLYIDGVEDANGNPIAGVIIEIETATTEGLDPADILLTDTTNKIRFTVTPQNSDGSEYVGIFASTTIYEFKSDGTSSGHGIKFTILQSDFQFKPQIGDTIVLNDLEGNPGYIYSMASEDKTSSIPGEIPVGVYINIMLEMSARPGAEFDDLTNASVWLHSDSHKNAGTQAVRRGPYDSGTGSYPPNSIDVKSNIDTLVTSGTLNSDIINSNRLNYPYEVIENDSDFDYKLEEQELNTFKANDPDFEMKLKFYGRDPNTRKIEIAIGNWYDFQTDSSNSNYAIAFKETIGVNTEFTYLTSLFEYSPRSGSTEGSDEIAIAIKHGDTIERWVVSMNPLSVDGNGRNNYIETVINEHSKLIFCVDNTSIKDVPTSYLVCDRYGWDESTGYPSVNALGTPTENLSLIGGRNPQLDEGDIRDAYFTVEDKERYEIDVVIGNEDYPNVAIELADFRKDCISYNGARYVDTVGKKAIDATNSILTYMKDGADGVKLTRTMFAADFSNYFRIYDKFNKKYRWINCSGDMAGIRCDVSSNHDAWWVSAGMKRGIIRNINKLAFTPSQAQRDNLYKAGTNPIVAFPGTGNLVWGNKTLHPIASSFDRINVRTLFNTLERAMAKAARSQVFEFNDPYTRNAIMSMFNPYLSTIKAGRGITDYLVICDETNNTPDVISRNELRVDIYIKPNYAAEMILLTFTNVGTRSFSDVVGV